MLRKKIVQDICVLFLV